MATIETAEKSANGANEILTYESVDISYDGLKVVSDVSFALHEGECLGIVGESGSGKSTLIRAAMGLLGAGGLVTRGDIWYRGLDLPDVPRDEMRRINGEEIAMIFQDAGNALCPSRKIGDQLYESMLEHGNAERAEFTENISRLLERLRFDDTDRILGSYPFELSGGMRQRIGIASAMMMNPKILLADEPTSALDVVAQKDVVEEMKIIKDVYHTSIIIVTHNIGVARELSDTLLVMKDGHAVEYGPTNDVLTNPQSDYTKKLISSVIRLKR